ncbi:S-adenosylmethionine-dependent methyltransferase [Oleiphilus messinensis]|uniref:S-adenosylmethionine-dependent methyltransferase n=1 Tax=Oleiphilus messinensis TaxID=141451 RepID=A0A1Y0IGT4_9GAMM|nr:class I SAM-dependent methyltransferase [Oleiphilus messinensis]ARU59510.1 S-adenosylmethionine-dependent methyltransferase [Oleiphilus messinensis]
MPCRNCGSYIQSPIISGTSAKHWYNSAAYHGSAHETDSIYLKYSSGEASRRSETRYRYKTDIAPRLKKNTPANILEVGAATGSLLSVCREHGHQVTGLDLSDPFIQQAKEQNNIHIDKMDFLDYPSAPETFDMIIMLGTISNLHNLDQHLNKAHNILTPSGLLYFNLPVANSAIATLYGRHYWMFTPSVAQFMSRAGYRTLLKNHDFTILSEALDRQKPSYAKLLGHTGLRPLYRILKALRMESKSIPISVPIPGIIRVVAQKESRTLD